MFAKPFFHRIVYTSLGVPGCGRGTLRFGSFEWLGGWLEMNTMLYAELPHRFVEAE